MSTVFSHQVTPSALFHSFYCVQPFFILFQFVSTHCISLFVLFFFFSHNISFLYNNVVTFHIFCSVPVSCTEATWDQTWDCIGASSAQNTAWALSEYWHDVVLSWSTVQTRHELAVDQRAVYQQSHALHSLCRSDLVLHDTTPLSDCVSCQSSCLTCIALMCSQVIKTKFTFALYICFVPQIIQLMQLPCPDA